MTDFLQNFQEVYKKWEFRSVPNRGRLRGSSYRKKVDYQRNNYENNTIKSNHARSQNFRSYKRSSKHTFSRYEGLAEFKMAPTIVSLHQTRPFIGFPCAKCVPHSRATIEDASVYLLGVYNILHIPYFPMQSFNSCYFWNLLKFNHQSLSYHGTTFNILKCERVQKAIEELVDKNKKDCTSVSFDVGKLYKRGQIILKSLKSSISSFCVEITGFCLHFILKKLFHGIYVHKGQIEILKILSQEHIPFIYLPLHRSYLDYILVTYILHMNSLKTPFTTIVDEIYIPVLSFIFRITGAIFVKSCALLGNCNGDILYNAILQSYIIRYLESGHDIQLYLEGCRSITGKAQLFNTNLLAPIVHSVSEGSIEDVYIVPVSISYETTEDNFVAERLGRHHKAKINFFSKLHLLWKLLHIKYGNVRVNFNQPFSLKEFLRSFSDQQFNLDNFPTNLPLYNSLSLTSQKTPFMFENLIQMQTNSLATHVIYDATNSTSLMCTHLLAFLFITKYRKGGTQQQLQYNMDWLRGEILNKKYDIGFLGESLPAIKRAVKLLGKNLITTDIVEMEWTSSDLENNNVKVKVYTPIMKLPHVLELQYYANAVVPLFLKGSIVVNALYALVDVDICHFHHCASRFYVSRDRLIQMAMKLNDCFKYEFISVPPCQDVMSSFNDVIDELIEKECLSVTGVDGYFKCSSRRKFHTLSFDVSSDEEQNKDEVCQQLKVDLTEESISHLEFLRSILSPYIESYWLGACSLLRLIDDVKEESVFIQEMQMTAQDKLCKGLLAYEESFSFETLKNCLKMFCDRQIIEYTIVDEIKTVCLTESYNCFERVNDVIADIEDFRK